MRQRSGRSLSLLCHLSVHLPAKLENLASRFLWKHVSLLNRPDGILMSLDYATPYRARRDEECQDVGGGIKDTR